MFLPDKILQEVIYLLSVNNNRMNVLKLMKELYLADRASIAERDSSISGDNFVSMPHGPVLSKTLNMLNDIPYNVWGNFLDKVEAPYHYDVVLKKEIDCDRLSTKDKKYLLAVASEFKGSTPFELEEYTHTLPEWVDPKGSSQKIRFSTVMKALGKTDEEISEAKALYDHLEELSSLE